MQHEGFPYPAIDPLSFLVDDEIRPFFIDTRHDLTGTGDAAAPILSTGVYIVHDHVVPENTAEVVMGMFPHCWARTNVGDAEDESVVFLDPNLTAGWVLFDMMKNNNQPYLVETNYNLPLVAPDDRIRQTHRGLTWGSLDARILMNVEMRNPLSTIYLPAKSQLRVIFQLAPQAAVGGVPNPYTIDVGGIDPDITNRIDFAGALVFGMRMPQQTYDNLRKARRMGQLGPEASVLQPPGSARSK